MAASTSNGGPYKVSLSGVIAKALKDIQRQASAGGRGDAVLSAFRQLVQRLKQAPTSLGEPLYQLPALGMEVRCVVIRPLAIDFGVCEDRSVVFIKGVKLLSRPSP